MNEPRRRVVIWKRAHTSHNQKEGDDMATNDGEINVSNGAQAAIQNAIDALTPHKAEPRVAALLGKLEGIAKPEGKLEGIAKPEDFGEGEEAIAKAMIVTDRLRKSEDVLPVTREHADAAHRALQLEHLGASNPRAAAAYEKARAA